MIRAVIDAIVEIVSFMDQHITIISNYCSVRIIISIIINNNSLTFTLYTVIVFLIRKIRGTLKELRMGKVLVDEVLAAEVLPHKKAAVKKSGKKLGCPEHTEGNGAHVYGIFRYVVERGLRGRAPHVSLEGVRGLR